MPNLVLICEGVGTEAPEVRNFMFFTLQGKFGTDLLSGGYRSPKFQNSMKFAVHCLAKTTLYTNRVKLGTAAPNFIFIGISVWYTAEGNL